MSTLAEFSFFLNIGRWARPSSLDGLNQAQFVSLVVVPKNPSIENWMSFPVILDPIRKTWKGTPYLRVEFSSIRSCACPGNLLVRVKDLNLIRVDVPFVKLIPTVSPNITRKTIAVRNVHIISSK